MGESSGGDGDGGVDSGRTSITSIMEAQHQTLGRGGVRGSHRERDRVRFLEAERKREASSRTEEPHRGEDSQSLSAAEREQVRKHREAYFTRKQRVPVDKEDEKAVEEEHVQGATESKQEAVGAVRTSLERERAKASPQVGRLAENEVRESPSKPPPGSTGANSVKVESGRHQQLQQKERVNENTGQVQSKAVGVGREVKRDSKPPQQPTDAKDGAKASGIYIFSL